MKRNARRLSILFALLVMGMAGCAGDAEPPYLGAFYRNGSSLTEIPQSDLYPFQAGPSDLVLKRLGAIIVNYPIPSIPDLVLQIVPGYERIPVTLDVQGDMIVEVRPRSPLPNGDYCLVVGDAMKSLENLTRWCFKISDGSETPTPAPAVKTRAKDGVEMVFVPVGEFTMGNPNWQTPWTGQEGPVHPVYLDAFWIDKTEISNQSYQQCVEAGACTRSFECEGGDLEVLGLLEDALPAACVNWYDASEYCAWAGARLPTEAEWEKAARGTDRRLWPWGDVFDKSRLNFCDMIPISYCETTGRLMPVYSFPSGASPYGALNMLGNVSEWVSDGYQSDYYSSSPRENPVGPADYTDHVIRGMSWLDGAGVMHCYNRHHADPDRRFLTFGFRCAVSAGE